MPTITTLFNKSSFKFSGSLTTQITIHYASGATAIVTQKFWDALLKNFHGRKNVLCGFLVDNPKSFGAWIDANSKALNGKKLSAKHGSAIAAILNHYGKLSDYYKMGSAGCLDFV